MLGLSSSYTRVDLGPLVDLGRRLEASLGPFVDQARQIHRKVLGWVEASLESLFDQALADRKQRPGKRVSRSERQHLHRIVKDLCRKSRPHRRRWREAFGLGLPHAPLALEVEFTEGTDHGRESLTADRSPPPLRAAATFPLLAHAPPALP